ncbi:nuclease-related domain-containing protein [Pseudalkalibacillus sp. SCS-8]|uniref:nuclease-related domain-containing protein n=1 Tax=Pseudalkalibacillus nanhaiensis TaxID=3115291 RepID=UPI0032DB9456
MNQKEVQIPLSLLQLLAFQRRLPQNSLVLPLLDQPINKLRAGFKGEKSVEYQLRYLQKDKYHIFHNIRLRIDNTYFQIDFLLISIHLIIIMEVKNISGTLYFDPVFEQIIRKKQDGLEEGFVDPTKQLKRQEVQLKKWLEQNNLPVLPIRSFVAISNPKTVLKTSIKNYGISNWIVHNSGIAFKIEEIEKQFFKSSITTKELKKVVRKLLKEDEPLKVDYLEKYNVKKEQILTGVQCPKCFHFQMKRTKASWECPACFYNSKTAYESAVVDYGLLFNQLVTNRQIRDFLGVKARTTNYLLKNMGIPLIGRKYQLTHSIIYHYAADKEV